MKKNGELERLMKEFQLGRKSAMVETFKVVKKPLFAYLYRLCHISELAEDLLQETFIAIFRHAGSFDSNREFLPWAYTIARNKFFEWKRENKKIVSFQQKKHYPEFEMAETRYDFSVQLSRLAEPMREAFILKHFQDLTFKEVAEIQGVPLTTAKSRVLTAAAKLRNIWEKNDE